MIKAFKMRLEYGMGPEFEKRHAEVWPEVAKLPIPAFEPVPISDKSACKNPNDAWAMEFLSPPKRCERSESTFRQTVGLCGQRISRVN